MTKPTHAALAGLLLFLSPSAGAIAQDAGGTQEFEAWDLDSDANIDTDEWNTGVVDSGVFARWDTDGDGAIGPDEFDDRFGRTWKTADLPVDAAGEPAETGSAAGDGLDFSTRFADASFTAWDADSDGSLSPEEFAAGVRGGYDASGDNRVDVNEWVDFDRDAAPGSAFGDAR